MESTSSFFKIILLILDTFQITWYFACISDFPLELKLKWQPLHIGADHKNVSLLYLLVYASIH